MDDIADIETIDVEVDDFLKKPQKARCTDPFLNILCGDDDQQILDSDVGVEDDRQDAPPFVVGDDEEDDDGVTFQYAAHDPTVKWNKMRPNLGERYENPQQCKLCLTNYAISNGYQIKFRKSDSVRVIAVCASDPKYECPFLVRASWMSAERSFQIKKMVDQHKCVRNYNNATLLNPTWLAKQFVKELIRKPNLKCKEMQAIVKSKLHCTVSWFKCYRARCRALSLIEGKLSDHYAKVWDYARELMRSNPESTVKVCVAVNHGESTFQRFYVCFKSLKEGWKAGCRRVLGLDGSFLKGQCKGELLTAVARDANNQMLPIAWAVVDIENKENWRWFMRLVDADLHLEAGRGLAIISDQHKGLLEAAKLVLPYAEHRQCARHIYANFRKVFSGLEFKNMFWAAAKSTTQGEFNMHMERIKAISPAAYEHLWSRSPSSWCRAFFMGGIACEAVENGIAECFNAQIVDARKKPLLAMLEEIRLYMMERVYNLNKLADKWDANICPAAVKKMHAFGQDIRSWYVCPSGVNAFETRNGLHAYGVNLEDLYCTCRLWEVSGIPCVHAQAAILYTQQDPVTYISDWFSKAKYKSTYQLNILPVNGSNMWQGTPFRKPLPPVARRMPGRPTIKRRRHATENEDRKYSQVSSKGKRIQCQNCFQYGHNKKTCKNPKVTPEPKPKKKMGRPKLDPDLTHWTGRGRGARGGFRVGRGTRVRGARVGGRGKRGGGTSTGGVDTNVVQELVETQVSADVPVVVADVPVVVQELVETQVNDALETVPETQFQKGESSNVDDVDIEDIPQVDKDHIRLTIKDLRASDYPDEEICDAIGLTEAELHAFDQEEEEGLNTQVEIDEEGLADVEIEEAGLDDVEIEEAGFEEESSEEEGIEDTQVEKSKVVRKKPSERITKLKLQKCVVDKHGRGMDAEHALQLD